MTFSFFESVLAILKDNLSETLESILPLMNLLYFVLDFFCLQLILQKVSVALRNKNTMKNTNECEFLDS